MKAVNKTPGVVKNAEASGKIAVTKATKLPIIVIIDVKIIKVKVIKTPKLPIIVIIDVKLI
jgi:hypothetical protein